MPPRDAKLSRRGIELRDKLSLAMDEGFHATCQAISCYRKASFCLFYSGNSSQNSNKKSGYNSVSQIWWPCYAILRIVCWRLVITNWCMMLTCLRRTYYIKGQDGLCFFPSWQMISSKGRPFSFFSAENRFPEDSSIKICHLHLRIDSQNKKTLNPTRNLFYVKFEPLKSSSSKSNGIFFKAVKIESASKAPFSLCDFTESTVRP